jgi:hypothetical protein
MIQESMGIINVSFSVKLLYTDQFSAFIRNWVKNWECNETASQLLMHFKKAYDSVRREVLCSILIEFGVLTKLARLIKMCLNETHSKVHIGKHLPDSFPI